MDFEEEQIQITQEITYRIIHRLQTLNKGYGLLDNLTLFDDIYEALRSAMDIEELLFISDYDYSYYIMDSRL